MVDKDLKLAKGLVLENYGRKMPSDPNPYQLRKNFDDPFFKNVFFRSFIESNRP